MERDRSLKSGEREVSDTLAGVGEWQKWRYYEAQMLCFGKTVYDVGCGAGYGSYILKAYASVVAGIDDSRETIDFAKTNYSKNGVFFLCADFMEIAWHLAPADVVVAFEFIEHLPNPEETFQAFGQIAKERIILSTPHDSSKVGKFHYQHFSEQRILKLIMGIGFRPEALTIVHFSGGPHVFCIAKRKDRGGLA